MVTIGFNFNLEFLEFLTYDSLADQVRYNFHNFMQPSFFCKSLTQTQSSDNELYLCTHKKKIYLLSDISIFSIL